MFDTLYKVVKIDSRLGFVSAIAQPPWQLIYYRDAWTKANNSKIFLFDLISNMEKFILNYEYCDEFAVFQVEAKNPHVANVHHFNAVINKTMFWRDFSGFTSLFNDISNLTQQIVLADEVILKKRIVKLKYPFYQTWRTLTSEEEAKMPGTEFLYKGEKHAEFNTQ